MWPADGILKGFLRGGLVARALWSWAGAGSGISFTELRRRSREVTFFRDVFFVVQNDAKISQ